MDEYNVYKRCIKYTPNKLPVVTREYVSFTSDIDAHYGFTRNEKEALLMTKKEAEGLAYLLDAQVGKVGIT